MLYSLCIKTNHKKIIHYLLKKLENSEFIFSENKFKIYSNIIIHSRNQESFYDTIAAYITDCILDCYEEDLVKKIINMNYFYFSTTEKSKIYHYAIKNLKKAKIENTGTIFTSVLNYILENKVVLLDGFIHFRLKDYISILDITVDTAVDNFLVQREYYEFVNLLKSYISSEKSVVSMIHLLYYNGEAILLDELGNTINVNDHLFSAKYLSDISFSQNDYTLNTLLTLIPEKIMIHLLCQKDEFIHTLILIFDQRIKFCNSCNLCNIYKNAKTK